MLYLTYMYINISVLISCYDMDIVIICDLKIAFLEFWGYRLLPYLNVLQFSFES